MSFPASRPRRLRRTSALRTLFRETTLAPADLIAPVFVHAGTGVEPLSGMPGVSRLDLDALAAFGAEAADAGLGGILLFGVPATKDPTGTSASADDGIVQQGLRRLRSESGTDLVLIADTCLCAYTDHGHCGVLNSAGDVDNDATLPLLAQTAVSQAAAGADIVAPSDMMDGRVGAIRSALDASGHTEMAVMSYAVKHASAFYGPFREAAGSSPQEGDRRGYQMDPANSGEALREAWLDVEEGADALIVKPAITNLDLIYQVSEECGLPVSGYAVSGEYAMIESAAAAGQLDRQGAVLESLTAIRRAGAGTIITYHALEAASWLRAR
ncbi:MAG: porphobilinogen synthase [Actinomycetes bacterium]